MPSIYLLSLWFCKPWPYSPTVSSSPKWRHSAFSFCFLKAVCHPFGYFGCPFPDRPCAFLQTQNPETHTTIKMFYIAEKRCPLLFSQHTSWWYPMFFWAAPADQADDFTELSKVKIPSLSCKCQFWAQHLESLPWVIFFYVKRFCCCFVACLDALFQS